MERKKKRNKERSKTERSKKNCQRWVHLLANYMQKKFELWTHDLDAWALDA